MSKGSGKTKAVSSANAAASRTLQTKAVTGNGGGETQW